MREVWTSYAGSDSGPLIDQLEIELATNHAQKVALQRYMRRTEITHMPAVVESDDDNDPEKPIVSAEDAPVQAAGHVWYYLRSGESIQMLAQRIGAVRDKVIVLSPAYFSSRWCMAELAFSLRKNRVIDPVIVDNLDPGVLAGLLSGSEKQEFALPERGSRMKFADALAETLKYFDPHTDESADSLQESLVGLSGNTFCAAEAAPCPLRIVSCQHV